MGCCFTVEMQECV